MAQIPDGGLKVNVVVEADTKDEKAVILFDLLKEIKYLREWRFEHCKHKTGWCRNKEMCERCEFNWVGEKNE